jgi:four helix bundle protein
MKIQKFEEIQAWKMARELTQKVYQLTKKPDFYKDFGLKNQIRAASGSSMHNIAEGFDAESNAEFIRFLRYAKRSCSEVQSELYVALDEGYLLPVEFNETYDLAGKTRAAIRGFINYLIKFEEQKNSKH